MNIKTTTEEPTNIDFAISTGTLQKPIYEMSADEKSTFYKEMNIETRRYLFSIGQPMVYKKGTHVVAEYADGTINIVR